MSDKDLIIEKLEDEELSDEVHQMAIRKVQEADDEIEQMRMQIRWGIKQVEVIKRAARLMGIPYQTYIKQALFHQAINDIEQAEKLFK